jgi:hypothetical protein
MPVACVSKPCARLITCALPMLRHGVAQRHSQCCVRVANNATACRDAPDNKTRAIARIACRTEGGLSQKEVQRLSAMVG